MFDAEANNWEGTNQARGWLPHTWTSFVYELSNRIPRAPGPISSYPMVMRYPHSMNCRQMTFTDTLIRRFRPAMT